jgi:hypothetical protein
MKNNNNKKRRRQNPYGLMARGHLPLTAISSNSNYKNKDFQDIIVGHFKDISNEIRSLQKALAHHRHDFNLRMSNVENLLSGRTSKIEADKGTSLHKKSNQN